MFLWISGLIFDCVLEILNSKFNSKVKKIKINLHLKSYYTFQTECCEAKKSAILIEKKEAKLKNKAG